MPRGVRKTVPSSPDLAALERELEQVKERQAELRRALRERKKGSGSIRALEAKAEKQLAAAKWTAAQILELNPEWNELAFYRSVQPKSPTPRGPRRRATGETEASGSES